MKIKYIVLIVLMLSLLLAIGFIGTIEKGDPIPNTSACAITSFPSNMEDVNSHQEVYGTGADPNIITLGPKTGARPEWEPYPNKHSVDFELDSKTPILAPIDMELIGVINNGAVYKIENGEKITPFDDLTLFFKSANTDWPEMIVEVYHLRNSPLVFKDSQSEVEEWGTDKFLRAEGHLFYEFDDYPAPKNAISPNAMIGRLVRRGELIGFAGNVGSHSMASFGFKVLHASKNPTVKRGNQYLHWVQPSSFFYWKCYGPNADFSGGILAYPFECNGYKLPIKQHNVNFKYSKDNS